MLCCQFSSTIRPHHGRTSSSFFLARVAAVWPSRGLRECCPPNFGGDLHPRSRKMNSKKAQKKGEGDNTISMSVRRRFPV